MPSALLLAYSFGHFEIIQDQNEIGSLDYELRYGNNRTCLQVAAQHGSCKAAEILASINSIQITDQVASHLV